VKVVIKIIEEISGDFMLGNPEKLRSLALVRSVVDHQVIKSAGPTQSYVL